MLTRDGPNASWVRSVTAVSTSRTNRVGTTDTRTMTASGGGNKAEHHRTLRHDVGLPERLTVSFSLFASISLTFKNVTSLLNAAL